LNLFNNNNNNLNENNLQDYNNFYPNNNFYPYNNFYSNNIYPNTTNNFIFINPFQIFSIPIFIFNPTIQKCPLAKI